VTISDAFVVDVAAAEPSNGHKPTPARAGTHPRMRARIRSVLIVIAWFKTMWVDLRSAWWTPASLPPLRRAWADRKPDRAKVPGDNGVIYGAWLVYSHTIGLAVPALAVAVVGILTPAVWVARHPARLVLAAVIAAPFLAAAVALN
jgi:hypothetical protein